MILTIILFFARCIWVKVRTTPYYIYTREKRTPPYPSHCSATLCLQRKGGEEERRRKNKKMHKCLVVCKKLYNFAAKFV